MSTILITRNETEADKEWTGNALKNRQEISIYSYNNLNNSVFMKNLKGSNTNIQIFQHDQSYKNYLMKACNDIQVDYPNDKDYSFKRDYYLIRDADSLYFNGYFDLKTKSRLQIKGRESWIIEMFVNKIQEIQKVVKDKLKPKSYSSFLPIYMFSEDLKCWCQLNSLDYKWIYITRPPKPRGKYLAIGSDPISNTARIEINLI
jgi:hypothetical protein